MSPFSFSFFFSSFLTFYSVMPEISCRRFADEGYGGGSLQLHFFAKNEADGIARGGKQYGEGILRGKRRSSFRRRIYIRREDENGGRKKSFNKNEEIRRILAFAH